MNHGYARTPRVSVGREMHSGHFACTIDRVPVARKLASEHAQRVIQLRRRASEGQRGCLSKKTVSGSTGSYSAPWRRRLCWRRLCFVIVVDGGLAGADVSVVYACGRFPPIRRLLLSVTQ